MRSKLIQFPHIKADNYLWVSEADAPPHAIQGDAGVYLCLRRCLTRDDVLDTLILPSVNWAWMWRPRAICMQVFVGEVTRRHRDENILMVVDGAGWHRSQAITLPK